MCKTTTHAPGCQRVACWAPKVDFGKCPNGCTDRGAYVADCTVAPGVNCSRCGKYWIPEGVPRETLDAMKADWDAVQAQQNRDVAETVLDMAE